MKKNLFIIILVIVLTPKIGTSQIDNSQLGAWYMYFFNTNFKESSWGVQGDIQYRNWDLGGDLEQLLIRGGLTYSPKNADIKFTTGYGHITTGVFGSDNATSVESRIYQEALFPTKIGKLFHLNHRFRYEQRFVENQDFRTRYRYNLFVTVPLNKIELNPKALYLAMYNELFINGQQDIGDGREVEYFDRNRAYIALGYILKKGLKVQFGVMNQKTNSWSKNQLQLSLHHNF